MSAGAQVEGDGDCFLAALYATREAVRIVGPKKVRLVHGLPVGTGPPIEGLRHWHAWIETPNPRGGTLAIDVSNGKQVALPRDHYYRLAQLTDAHVWRYTPGAAERLIKARRTAGPWVPGWEGMGLIIAEDDDPPEPTMRSTSGPGGTEHEWGPADVHKNGGLIVLTDELIAEAQARRDRRRS